MHIVQILSITTSGFIFIIIIELIRRNLLKERYSLIWLAASVAMIIFSVWRSLLHFAARFVGIHYPPSFLFVLAIIFLLVLLLHFSIVVSSLCEKNKRLAQEIGILKAKMKDIESHEKEFKKAEKENEKPYFKKPIEV